LNEKWGQLHQDKLQSCIRQHRLVRDSKPDISAIHKAYCALIPQNLVGEREVEQTRNDLQRCTPISPEEFAEWDVWAEAMLKNVSDAELEQVREFIGHVPESRRILAVAVEHVRKPSVRYA
jgi:replication initiation and membrane attachment protein DnaB